MPHIEVLPLGELQTNCYLVWDQDPERVVVVDPGDDIPALRRALQGREAAGVLIISWACPRWRTSPFTCMRWTRRP